MNMKFPHRYSTGRETAPLLPVERVDTRIARGKTRMKQGTHKKRKKTVINVLPPHGKEVVFFCLLY